jgi:hypothetical protein
MDRTEALAVLASADRQLVLHELVERDRTVTLEGLSRSVAARRHQIPAADLDDRKIDRARYRLRHTHLPKLAEEEIIDPNWEDSVSLADGERADRVFGLSEELECWPPDGSLGYPSRSW